MLYRVVYTSQRKGNMVKQNLIIYVVGSDFIGQPSGSVHNTNKRGPPASLNSATVQLPQTVLIKTVPLVE